MEPLKKVQVEGHLMYAEPQDIFGNLDEICYVSFFFLFQIKYLRLVVTFVNFTPGERIQSHVNL